MAVKKLLNSKGDISIMLMRLVGMILLATVLIVAIVRDRIVSQPQWQVSVIGQGKVSFVPDTAKINLGVQVEKVANAEEALKELNTKMEKIITAVSNIGIAKENIQTQNYSLYPQYDVIDGISKISGYGANEQLVITVSGVDKDNNLVGKVISESTKAGANQVNGVSFEPANLEVLKQQARLMAIADAQVKAKQLSQAMHVRLGKVVGWWENYPQPYYDGKGGMGAGGVMNDMGASLPVGNGEISLELNISYQIK